MAQGLTQTAIGQRLGVSKQAVQQLLQYVPCARPSSLFCSACGALIPAPRILPGDIGRALCLPCLDRHPAATFGQRLKALRLAAGLMLDQLDRRAGIGSGRVSAYERELSLPTPATRAKLAQALGVSVTVLEMGAPSAGQHARGQPRKAP